MLTPNSAAAERALPPLPFVTGSSRKYKDAQTQTSWRDASPYRGLRGSDQIPRIPIEPNLAHRPGATRRSRRSHPARTDWRSSILSLYGAHTDNDVTSREWEADLAAFRLSWYDPLELIDLYSSVQSDDGDDKAKDPNIVDWDGPDDPENPLNWSNGRKWANIVTFSTITMIRYGHFQSLMVMAWSLTISTAPSHHRCSHQASHR